MVTLANNFLFNCPTVSILRSCNRLILISGFSAAEILTKHMTGEWEGTDELLVQQNHEYLKIGSGTVISHHNLLGGSVVMIKTDLKSGDTEIEVCPQS